MPARWARSLMTGHGSQPGQPRTSEFGYADGACAGGADFLVSVWPAAALGLVHRPLQAWGPSSRPRSGRSSGEQREASAGGDVALQPPPARELAALADRARARSRRARAVSVEHVGCLSSPRCPAAASGGLPTGHRRHHHRHHHHHHFALAYVPPMSALSVPTNSIGGLLKSRQNRS